jgi:hypothetical protein
MNLLSWFEQLNINPLIIGKLLEALSECSL